MTHIPHDYRAPSHLLEDHNILVTGAGDGIGAVAAKTYAAYGATVILLGRTTAKLEQVYDDIVAENLPQPIIFEMDLLTAEQAHYTVLCESVLAELGCLHGLLHNASLLGERTSIENTSPQKWNEVIQVNLTAQMLLTQSMLPALKSADQASVIFTSSGVGRSGRAYWGAYAVSKFATEGLMQVLADELANVSQIRVNSLNPGGTRTRMRASAYPAEDPKTLPTPEDIMFAYLYLMGVDSRATHGQALSVR